jgi:hypothetical protein
MADDTPAMEPAESMTQDYVRETISSAVPESDLKYLDERPEKTTTTRKAAKKPEIGDSEIPLDDDEPEKVIDEGEEEEEEDESPPQARNETERAKADAKWKQYREAYKEVTRYRSENQDLKRKLEAASDTKETEQLREAVNSLYSERQRLIQLVEMGNIEQSEIWQRDVTEPLNVMWEDIQNIAKRNGMDPTKLAHIIQAGDDVTLNDYMDEHSTRPGDRNYLFRLIPDVQQIDRRKNYLRHHASELSQRNMQDRLAQRDQYMQGVHGARAQAVNTIFPKIQEKILSVLPKDKRRDLNKDVRYIMDYENWDEDIKMFGGVAAVVLPDLLDSYNLLRRQYKEAKQELVRLRGGSPKVSPSGRAATTPPTRRDEDEEAPVDKLAKTNLSDFAEESTKRIRQAMGFRK